MRQILHLLDQLETEDAVSRVGRRGSEQWYICHGLTNHPTTIDYDGKEDAPF